MKKQVSLCILIITTVKRSAGRQLEVGRGFFGERRLGKEPPWRSKYQFSRGMKLQKFAHLCPEPQRALVLLVFLPQQPASHFPTLPLCTFAPTGEVGFEPCYADVLRVVQGKLHQPDEVQRGSFYAFSYYYDRAVDTDMIGKFMPGVSAGGSWASLWWGREGTKEYLQCFVELLTLLCSQVTQVGEYGLESFGARRWPKPVYMKYILNKYT